ncbi:MAG: AgmX/PglI C-terminal domain-containing protein, partial [Acidobacteriota bacterium]
LASAGVAVAALGVFAAWRATGRSPERPPASAPAPRVAAATPAPAPAPAAEPAAADSAATVPPTRTVGPPPGEELTLPPDAGASPRHPESRQAPHSALPPMPRSRTIDKTPAPAAQPPKPAVRVDANGSDAHPAEAAPAMPPPVKPASTPVPAPARAPAPAAGPKPGAIDIMATRAAVRPHLAAVQRCFERAKMDDMSLTGSLSIRISLAGDGSVTRAEVAKSTLGSPSAERCIVQEVGTWHLPPPGGGVAATFVYPFVFE